MTKRAVAPFALGAIIVLLPVLYLVIKNPQEVFAAPWSPVHGNYSQRKQLTLVNNSGQTFESGSTYKVSIDTASLYNSGSLLSSCDDLRIVYQPSNTTATELKRAVEYASTASGVTTCGTSSATKVVFQLQASIANAGTDANYYIYYDNVQATAYSSSDALDAYNVGSKEATFVAPFNGTTTALAAGSGTPTTATGAIRYSGGKSALSFDGSNDLVNSGSDGSVDNMHMNVMTVESWVKVPPSATSWHYIATKGNIWRLAVSPGGLLDFGVSNGSVIRTYSNQSLADNTWHHVAATYDDTGSRTPRLWIDGVEANYTQQNPVTGTVASDASSELHIGNISTTWPFIGQIDELRISNTIRYTANFTPQTTPFVRDEYTKLLLHFDENGDDPRNTGKAIDDSGNGNHGTITGAKNVSGLVGVDASATDTGKAPSQSYASHDGVFIEEGTTNKITNPSFEHTTYDTNWAAGGNSFETFTQGNQSLAKRNAPGPFTAAPIVQGDPANANSLTDDVLSTSRGHAIGGNFYQTFDTTQGSVVLWWTPEYSYNALSASSLHYIWYVNANYYLAYNYANDRYEQRIGAQTVNISANIVAGTTYSVVSNWDTKAPLSGSNYQCFTIDDGTPTCGTTQPTASAPSSFIYIGSNGTTGGGSGIIEGLTVYRRPLFDGTNGIDMGNGDEISLTSGATDRDPTLSTGSWDVVFALPTNSSVGAVSSGTGEAWSHPHVSNLLGGTNGASGFMLNGTYTSDGFVAEGTPSSVAALSASEKIYGGGYKVTSDAANEGIYKDITVTAGQDFVIRGLAHSDGTAVPKLILYDQTNGAEIGSLTGTTTSTRTAPNMLLFTGEVPTGCTTIRVKLINTAASGTAYWHQVEVMNNLVNNPSMEGGSGDPYVPTGWSGQWDGGYNVLDAGDSIQETTIVHSGSNSFRLTSTATNADGISSPVGAHVANAYYAQGGQLYGNGSSSIDLTVIYFSGRAVAQHSLNTTTLSLTNTVQSWNHKSGVKRQRIDGNPYAWPGIRGASADNILIDDVYSFRLTDIQVFLTPSSQTNSTETAGLRVDGRDTAIQEISSLSDSSGSIKFKYTPRHSAADALKFIEVTDAYIAEFVGTATDYIRLYWNAANTITLAYSMNGTTGSSTWNATGAIVAGTTYDIQIDYTGGSNMTLAVAGTTRITLSSIPANFAVAPYLAFWGSRKEGDRQGDALFAPATTGSTFILNDVRFTPTNPSLAKRNGSSSGPFTAGALVQGDPTNTNGLTDDTLSFHREKSISEYFYTNFDTTQGTVALWWTPEYSYNSLSGSGLHYLYYANANYYLAYDYANDRYQLGAGGQTMTVASNIVAGTSQGLVARWDTKTTLDGNNYAALSIDDTHTYGITSQPSASVPATKIYVGSNGTTGAASGLIEGLTIYRRVLFDGTYGVNANAGVDEVTVVKNSGGSDPTLTTGSWDIVFALPTNSTVGSLVTGTGEAWSHPHVSNLLGGTNGASGFMLNGTYTTDGFADEGTPSSVAALSASEKIYGGGYKVTSDAANEGIYKDITVTAGQDFVIRGLAHSDGTAVPKLIFYDQTNGAEIGSLTGTTTSTRTAPNMLLFTGEAPTGCTTIRVKLINTATTGTAYWHQVEVQANLFTNPSMESGSGDPWIPTGWANYSGTAGEYIQESSNTHSGLSSTKWASASSFHGITQNPATTFGKFYTHGLWGSITSGSGTGSVGSGTNAWSKQSALASGQGLGITGSAWSHYSGISRRLSSGESRLFLWPTSNSTTMYCDDIYSFQLSDVSIIVTPATANTSTESNQLRVDGRDTYTHTLPSLTASSGTINFSYTPRHSAADVAKFGETTPYITKLMSGATDYIALYWSAANTLRLEYQMNGGTVTNSTWTATGAITAGTTYAMQISYTGGGTMVLAVDGTPRITLSSIPSTFADAPNIAYWGSNSNGANQGDATIVPQVITATENTTAPYSKYATSSAQLVNTSGDSRGFVTSLNPSNTNTHTLSAYVYDGTTGNVGGAVSATAAKLVFNGSVVTPSAYTDMGGGWWRLSYSAATANASGNYGVQALSGKTIYVDGVQLEEKAYATTYTDGTMGTGYAWTGTSNESTSTRTEENLQYSSNTNITPASGSISFWTKPTSGRWNWFFSTNDMGWISTNAINIYWTGTPGGSTNFRINGSTTSTLTCNGITADKWNFIVATWTNGITTCRINTTVNSSVMDQISSLGSSIQFSGNSIYPLDAILSNFTIYSSVLTSNEMDDLYYAGLGSHSSLAPVATERYTDGEPPVLAWHLNEGYGTTAYDTTIYQNSGTISGATWSDDSVILSGSEGSRSLKFDGVDDKISRTYANDPELNPGTNAFSVGGWFKHPSTVSGTDTLISRYSSTGSGGGYKVYMNSSGFICFGVDDDTTWGPDDSACTTVSYADSAWHHVLAIKGTSTIAVYIDGTQKASTAFTVSSSLNGSSPTFYTGIDSDGTSNPWDGFIDEVRVYNSARSEEQINQEYIAKGTNKGVSAQFGSGGASDTLTKGLVGHWKMDEASWNGTAGEVLDASGNGNNGTSTNGATTASGKYGNGGSFDGSNDYVNIGASTSLNITNQLTVSAWVYPLSGQNSDAQIIARYGGYGLGLPSNTSLKFYFWGQDASIAYSFSSGTWYQVAATYDGIKRHFYVNGSEIGNVTTTSGPPSSPSGPGRIGNLSDVSTHFFKGSIDEARIYNRALSPAEVRALYEYAPGPVAYWTMDEGSGQSAYDKSGNSNTGTLGASSAVGSDDPTWTNGKYGKALSFDGSNDYVTINDTEYLSATTSGLSVSAWIKATRFDGTFQLSDIVNKDDNLGIRDWQLVAKDLDDDDVDASLTMIIKDNEDDALNSYTTSESLTINDWYFIEGVYDGTSSSDAIKLYINGVLASKTNNHTGTFGTPKNSSNNLRIGHRPTGNGEDTRFNGSIDDVKIYNYARTQKQIVSDMNAGHPAVGSPVGSAVAHYKFDEGQGTVARNSGNGGSTLNGTLTNMSSPATSTSGWTNDGKFGKALNFDGSNDYVELGGTTAFANDTSGTISLWANNSGRNTENVLFGTSRNASATLTELIIEYDSRLGTNKVWALVRVDGVTQWAFYTTNFDAIANAGSWHNFILVHNGTEPSFYIDGRLANIAYETSTNKTKWYKAILTDATNKADTTSIGTLRRNGGLVAPAPAAIDEVKIYNYALSEDEVKLEYNAGKAIVMGNLGTTTDGKTASNAQSRAYCPPGNIEGNCAAGQNPAPVAEWNFDEGSGSSVNDSSGNSITGTWGGTGTHWGTGKIGKAGRFGGNTYADVITTTELNGDAFFTRGTISFWFKINSNATWNNWNSLVNTVDNTAGTPTNWLNITKLGTSPAASHILIYFTDGSGGQSVVETTNTYGAENGWTYLTLVWNQTSNSVDIYANGKLDKAATGITTWPSIFPTFFLGKDRVFGERFFDGYIDQFKIYPYARTPAQIAWDYNQGLPAIHYKFNECTGTTINNSVPSANDEESGNNGTLTIGASGTQTSAGTCSSGSSAQAWTNGKSGAFNTGMALDGTDDYITTGDTNININSVSVWVRPASTSQSIIDLDGGTHTITVASGTIAANGFATPTIYVDGKVSTTLPNTDWHMITVTSATAFEASNLVLGKIASSYFNGRLDEFKMFTYPLTREQVKLEYNDASAVKFKAEDTEKWWLAGGVDEASAVAVYQPKGAASLADSYSNLANPGTYDATPGVAPTWASSTGWTFNGSTQYLRSPVYLNGATDTVIVRFSDVTNGGYAFGVVSAGTYLLYELTPQGVWYRLTTGAFGTGVSPGLSSGVLAMVPGQGGYRNGVLDTALSTAGVSSYWFAIGARTANSNANPQSFLLGKIQAFAVYNTRLTADQVAKITAKMQAL